MATKIYDPGDAIVIETTVTDLAGQPVDPATFAVHLADPAGTATVITTADSRVTHPSTGQYTLLLTPPTGGHASGAWLWRVVMTLPYLEEPGVFVVRPRQF